MILPIMVSKLLMMVIFASRRLFLRKHKYDMSLPVKFVKAAGLEYNSSVKVKDHEGKEWLIGIQVESYRGTKYSLSTSWCIFRRSHQLSDGDVCYFKFDKKEGVLNLTKVVRNKRSPPTGIGSSGGVTIENECSPIEKLCDGGGGKVANRIGALEEPVNGVKVKFEAGSGSVEAVKKKMGRLSVDKPGSGGGVKEKTGQETERLHSCKIDVVYF